MQTEHEIDTAEHSLKKPFSLPRLVLLATSFFIITLLALLVVSTVWIGKMNQYIIETPSDVIAPVGIVFGAGVNENGKPYEELQARLDSGADALLSGKVRLLILSGDNRFVNYNEPDAMKNYLIDSRGIAQDKLQVDYAGRSTYETCERARKVFSVDKAILFSSYTHLPRAIFTCRHFGIESYGIGNNLEANNAGRREPLARIKALFNIYVFGEKTILGEKIELNL